MSEPVEDENDVKISAELVDTIKNAVSLGGTIVPHDDIDCPTVVKESTLGNDTHTVPLVSEGTITTTEFKPEKAVANDGDTLFNSNSPLDDGDFGDE